MSSLLHKTSTPKNLKIAVLSISTTRRLENDKSGLWIKKQAKKEGHEVVLHQVVTDDINAITEALNHVIDRVVPNAVIMTGGTGISPKDVTIEAVRPMFNKELTAFGPVFAQLSFDEIDSAAILSRSTAGIINESVVFCMPGSLKACKLACNELIFPELGHLLKHIKE